MSRETTLITIPREHLPATVRKILAKPGDNIIKTQSLLVYEYVKKVKINKISPKTKEMVDAIVDTPFVEELKSPAEGKLAKYYVHEGEIISSEE